MKLIDIENATFSWSEEDAVAYGNDFAGGALYALDKLSEAPTVEGVPLEVWEQTAWERDIAIGQLEEHGITFGCVAPDVIKLPCKIGDYVWVIRSYRGHKHPPAWRCW